jgi:carbamoyltransferase
LKILGINYFFHDSSACIVDDGELVVALEEERFSRSKHTTLFPDLAIARCLEVAGCGYEDIDHVAVSINPTKDWHKKVVYGLKLGHRMWPFVKHELIRAVRKQYNFNAWYKEHWPSGNGPTVHNVDHHLSHIAGSFFISPYDRAALLSIDGSGEWSTTWMGETDGRNFTCYSESEFPNSLGSFYEAATQFCGFRPNYDEGKTMGLAPFGDPERFYHTMAQMVEIGPRGEVKVDLSWFNYQTLAHWRLGDKYVQAFGRPRQDGEPIEKHHEDVAAAAQRVLEDRVLEMCRILERESSADYLVISGGVSLNSVMNGRILRETRFKDVYVMPAAGDNGTSIGAAYYVYNHKLGATRRYHHNNPYLGTEYDSEFIERTLKQCKLPYERLEDASTTAARLLGEGKIIGWFQGRMEIGPRALGSRSILANPTLPDMKAKINAEVKHREAYRPFAPSATVECAKEYFDIEVEAPFMLKVCDVKPDKRELLPAITHVDGSARLHTVRAEISPRYHKMIAELGKISGVPVVLNTSFNIMGEPVVESPLQAIRCFFSTGLDALVIGDFLVRKDGAATSVTV